MQQRLQRIIYSFNLYIAEKRCFHKFNYAYLLNWYCTIYFLQNLKNGVFVDQRRRERKEKINWKILKEKKNVKKYVRQRKLFKWRVYKPIFKVVVKLMDNDINKYTIFLLKLIGL